MKVRVIKKNNGRYYVQQRYFGIWFYLDHRYRLSIIDGYVPEWFIEECEAINFLNTYKETIIKNKDGMDTSYIPKIIEI